MTADKDTELLGLLDDRNRGVGRALRGAFPAIPHSSSGPNVCS